MSRSSVASPAGHASRLRAATLVAYDGCGASSVPVPLLRLRAGRDTTVVYPVPTARRGVVGIGPLRVVRRDPLGLLTLPRSHGGVDQVWVYPRVHQLTAVPAGVVRSLDGLIDRVPHGSITFDTLREYVVGDELRHVHWRTTARVGELMVREHVDTSLPRLVVLLDDRAAAYPAPESPHEPCEAFEAVCEAAASIVVAAARDELPIALQLVGGVVVDSAGRRGHGTRPYLDALAEAELAADPQGEETPGTGAPGRGTPGTGAPGAGTRDGDASVRNTAARDLVEVATSRLRHRRLGDTLIFLTGPNGTPEIGRIGSLRGAYPTIVVGMLGAGDQTPPAVEGVLVLTADDGPGFAAAWDGVRGW